jgi:hypothetical protein
MTETTERRDEFATELPSNSVLPQVSTAICLIPGACATTWGRASLYLPRRSAPAS